MHKSKTKIVTFHPETWSRLKALHKDKCKAYHVMSNTGEDIQLVEFNVDSGKPRYAGVLSGSIVIFSVHDWGYINIEYPLPTKLVDYDHNIKNPIAVYYCYVGGRDLVHDLHFFKNGKLICSFLQKDKDGNDVMVYHDGLTRFNLKMEVNS